MAGVDVTISVEDEFSESLDKFNKLYDRCAENLDKYEIAAGSSEKKTKDLGDVSERAASGIGQNGLGGAFLMLNQAMQFFDRIAERVSKSLDDIGDKQRSFIIFGREAGAEFNNFARTVASSMGRAENEIRKSGQRFGRLGVGGENIKELTKLADRFANLNPGREFTDVSDALADAIKGRSASGLADLLGGGEFVEQKLERKHIDRDLKRGNLSGAIEKFKQVADELGYTQEKADEFGMTFDRKIQRITERVKNYFSDMISDVVSIFEPYVDKFLDWLNDEDVQDFFVSVKENVTMAAAAAGALLDTIVDGWSQIADIVKPAFDFIGDLVNEYFPWLKDESMSLVDTLTAILVGGAYSIFYGVLEGLQHTWNILATGIETDANWIIGICEDIANGAIGIAEDIRVGIINIVSDLVEWVAGLVEDLAKNPIGEMLGITEAADAIHQITSDLQRAKVNGFEKIHLNRVNLDEVKVDPVDSVKLTADAIDGALDKVHSFFNRSIDNQNRIWGEQEDEFDSLNDGLGKIVSMGQKEQDLRWLKEMAEQRFINEINLRQLTPTINLQVKGTSNQTPNEYAKSLAFELQKMADAGTFNAYGNVG
jgi:hypothetical protein